MKNIQKYRRLKNLFLRQSYLDAWEDYMRSVRKNSYTQWDYIVLTASNEAQAEAFKCQIKYRQELGVLPKNTKFLVIPDPEGKRIGSGGATLQVLRVLSEQEGFFGNFQGKRILVIHSGGDSKRVPQYSVYGKLFSPVPRVLPDGRSSTLFDEFLIGMAGVPSRFKEGMLVLSGDVLLLFNPLQIDAQFSGAAAISMKSPVEIGKDHGVFLNDGTDHVQKFLHKQTVETLQNMGAVNNQGNVDLDTGAVLCSAEMLEALFSLIAENGEIQEDRYSQFVNERSRISFYGDFLYPLAKESTLEQFYLEQPEGEFCDELKECRTKIWEALHEFPMKLICLSPAEFIHFGTTGELLSLLTKEISDYEFLDWKPLVSVNREECSGAVHNSFIGDSVKVEEDCYIESSMLTGGTVVHKGAVVSMVTLEDIEVPENSVFHSVRLRENNEYVLRIYGVYDNPKKTLEENGTFLNGTMRQLLENAKVGVQDIWNNEEHTLWTAKIYPSALKKRDAQKASMVLLHIMDGTATEEEILNWKNQRRYSLQESFMLGDTTRFIEWSTELQNQIMVEKFLKRLFAGEYYIPALKIFGESELNERQFDILMEKVEHMTFSEKIRVLYAVSRSMKYQSAVFHEIAYDKVEKMCFDAIQKAVCLEDNCNEGDAYHIQRDKVRVTLPVRVNWGGGWTDTPPYCNEKGGVVLNAAILLKGERQIEVEVRKLEKLQVEFASLDFQAYGTAISAEEIQDCNNPYDSFALHKAALIACGIIPQHGTANLQDILKRLGGGIYISTRVCNVPKGSGLGTSSILAGAAVKAIGEFLGEDWPDNVLYQRVLNLEQIMSTGGGWQDQVGGLTPGIKYITTKPGMKQEIKVEHIELDEETKAELQERFALIYTGQRRLARNLLRYVVGGYIGGRLESIEALEEMKHLAVLMRYELEQGQIDEFAKLLNRHWEISKKLDAESTNTCIDQIFESCEDLIDGKFISGAGGGGFLQVILKKGVTKEHLKGRLRNVFQDSGVDVWESEFLW
ncbi:fucose pyrophosphorylase domain-containing protein [Blautia sp. XA-2221]|uniref:fucose pyrophosphorylase domain-containing protein n=1 Tax=Blautia sp. XA-2221 TaxID=2903961 RepID=UPI002377E93B|nr:L-fucokinase [Blautia sp. XA-2221]